MERKTKHAATLKTFLGHYYNASFLYLVIILVFYPFIQSILGYNRGTVIRQPLEPACQNKCVVSVHRSSVDKFDSFSLDSTQVLFVHFSGYNLSLEPSDNDADILDPLNLVWADSIEAPFLSMDLDFIAYSFTTLSRIINHMKVNVDVEPINCLQNLSHSCVTANLARTFLGNVTLERGVLCYAVNDSNTVNYRCCKGNVHTQQVECDIPVVLNPEMAAIFITIVIAAAITLLCLPALFNIVPDKKKSETLCFNSQVYNPLYRRVICAVQALRHFSTEYYWVNSIRKMLIVLALPTLYYVDLGLLSYTITYEIPKMFNDSVKNLLVASKDTGRIFSSLFVILTYNVVGILVSLLPKNENLQPLKHEKHNTYLRNLMQLLRSQEKDIVLNWLEPFFWTKNFFCWLRSLLEARSSRFVTLLGSFVLMLLSPVVTILTFISYIWYVSPLGKMLLILSYHASLYCARLLLWLHYSLRPCFNNRFAYLLLWYTLIIPLFIFLLAFARIFHNSLLLSARLIVYLWIGLVASKDYYFPRIAIISVFVYYSWNCVSSVTSRYQILLKQTFEKCKEHQEKHLNGRKAITFDDNGVPRISHELLEHVIEQILPRSEVYTIMILKLTIIILFLVLTFSSILIYEKSSLNESTKALAVLMTGLLPKVFEVFSEGSSYWNLVETENACRIEKIVKDFLSQTQGDIKSNIEDIPVTTKHSHHFISSSVEEESNPSHMRRKTRIIMPSDDDDKDVSLEILREGREFTLSRRQLSQLNTPRTNSSLSNYLLMPNKKPNADPLKMNEIPPESTIERCEKELLSQKNSVAYFKSYGSFDLAGIRLMKKLVWLHEIKSKVAFETTWLQLAFKYHSLEDRKKVEVALLDSVVNGRPFKIGHFQCNISAFELSTLCGEGYLCDETITFMVNLYCARANESKGKAAFFVLDPLLVEGDSQFEAILRNAFLDINIKEVEAFFWPYYMRTKKHWGLCVFWLAEATIRFDDGLHCPISNELKKWCNQILDTLHHITGETTLCSSAWSFARFKEPMPDQIVHEKQEHGTGSCGVGVILAARDLIHGIPFVWTFKNAMYNRAAIMLDIVNFAQSSMA